MPAYGDNTLQGVVVLCPSMVGSAVGWLCFRCASIDNTTPRDGIGRDIVV
jgi:hypothetical protein